MREVLDYTVVPKHYDLKVKINPNCFSGEVTIYLHVNQKTNKFNFNSLELDLNKFILTVNNVEIETKIKDNDLGVISVELVNSELKKDDDVFVYIEFTGQYSDDMWGFYKSKYNLYDLYSTDFEPTNARKAFPCWDQPDMKATFNIAVEPLEGYCALSNSSLKEIKDGVYYFNTTPKMSTYIVAYISGVLESYNINTKRNVPIKVYAHPDETEWGAYAAKVAAECLDFFEEYFGIDYPLPKLDLVTIPTFVSGAMENWGLVTFRKTSLLYKEKSSSLRSKKIIAETVCHELAHMWFGNLVTMKWWNDLWLNEGFATWAASLAMYNLSKNLIDWDVWTDFISNDIEAGMTYDCLDSSHPIAVEVNNPSEISQIFDNISYSKGASMIRMLEGYIGAETFRDGIRKYLNNFKFDNATTDDLWKSFPESLNVADLMNDWINRKGYPILKVGDTPENDEIYLDSVELADKNTIINENDMFLFIRQHRFLMANRDTTDLWKVPVCIKWFNEESNIQNILITLRDCKIKKNSSLYKFNFGATGFYRVQYPLHDLTNLLAHDLSTPDRLNIVNDLFAIIDSKQRKAYDGVILSKCFKEETNADILSAVLSSLYKFKSIFYDSENAQKNLQKNILDLVATKARQIDLFKILNVEKMSTNKILLQYAFLSGDEQTILNLQSAYKRKDNVCPDYLGSVFSASADLKYEELFNIYCESKLPEEKVVALSSLAMIQNSDILLKMLKKYQEIEPHNSIYLFLPLSSNIKNRKMILNFVCDEFDNIRSFMKNDRLFQYVIERILGIASTKDMANRIKDILINKRGGEITSAVDKTIEKICHTLEFKKFNENMTHEN